MNIFIVRLPQEVHSYYKQYLVLTWVFTLIVKTLVFSWTAAYYTEVYWPSKLACTHTFLLYCRIYVKIYVKFLLILEQYLSQFKCFIYKYSNLNKLTFSLVCLFAEDCRSLKRNSCLNGWKYILGSKTEEPESSGELGCSAHFQNRRNILSAT